MRKFTKTLAVVLSLSMTLTMGTPVFAEGTADSSNTVTTVVEAPVVTPTPAQENKPPKTGFYKKAGKTYYYKNGKLIKNKYGYKIKNKYYHINKKGVVTTASTAEKLAAIRLKKCGGNLKKAFTWSSTKIKYFGGVKKPGKSKNAVEYYAAYGFKYGKGDCYVMAATFCMMAKVKGFTNVKFVKGTIQKKGNVNSAHAWCEIKSGKTTYVYDPNFANEYRNNPKAGSGYKFKYNDPGTLKYNDKKTKISF